MNILTKVLRPGLYRLPIRKTCPCNVYPLEHHFYIAKLGFAGVYLFFLFLLQNIDCGYSLEPPRYVLSKNKKNIKYFLLKSFNFYSLKYLCILHGRVFVMQCTCTSLSISSTLGFNKSAGYLNKWFWVSGLLRPRYGIVPLEHHSESGYINFTKTFNFVTTFCPTLLKIQKI